MTWTVYALVDAAGVCRYIGITRETLHRRLTAHVTEAQWTGGPSTPKLAWIRSMLATGERPRIEALETGIVSPDCADERERAWIAFARALGCPLVNASGGGGGAGAGRPVSSGRGHKGRQVLIRLTLEERARIVARAASHGLTAAEFARRVALTSAAAPGMTPGEIAALPDWLREVAHSAIDDAKRRQAPGHP